MSGSIVKAYRTIAINTRGIHVEYHKERDIEGDR